MVLLVLELLASSRFIFFDVRSCVEFRKFYLKNADFFLSFLPFLSWSYCIVDVCQHSTWHLTILWPELSLVMGPSQDLILTQVPLRRYFEDSDFDLK